MSMLMRNAYIHVWNARQVSFARSIDEQDSKYKNVVKAWWAPEAYCFPERCRCDFFLPCHDLAVVHEFVAKRKRYIAVVDAA